MYYFNLFACLGGVIAALSLLKYLDLNSGLTMVLGMVTILLSVFGIAWFSAKDSAAEAAKKANAAAESGQSKGKMQAV